MNRVLSLVAALTLAACSRSTPAAANSESPSQNAPPVEAAAKPVPTQWPDVIARVNGETISKGELETAVGELEAQAGRAVPANQRDRVVRGALDRLVAYKLLVQESTARKIAVPETDVDARIAEIRSQFPSEQAFTSMLEQRKLTLAGLRSDVREGMQIDKLLDAEVGDKTAVTAEQVDDFYAKNPAEFQQAESVRASHILIRVPEGADAQTKEQARARAADILKDVEAGKNFATLAQEHSQDPGSAPNGGDLGAFERGQMVGPFEQSAFSLTPGQTSDLVETQFGFHIIKVVDKQAARTIPLADVRPQVEAYLRGQNRERAMRAFVESLKTKGKVEILI